MSSREIALITSKRHTDVMRDIRNMYDQLGESISASAYKDAQGKERRQYELDRDMTLTLVSGYNVKLRKKIIDRWSQLEKRTEPSWLENLTPQARIAISDLSNQLEAVKPKAEYHDKVLAAPNGMLTTEVAQDFGLSAIKLNKELEKIGIQRRVGGRWVLRVFHQNKGYTTDETFLDEEGRTHHSMKWTEKGRKFIHELLEG